jgi:carbamoyl-phosphate synthase small subunit
MLLMKILVVDNYDSFVYNIVHLLYEIGVAEIDVVKNDHLDFSYINQYDKIVLSPGPGIPKNAGMMPQLLSEFASTKSILGICLGHQILGLSQGLKTEKMFNGHRGINHPIKNVKTGRGEITSQNHGFVISSESVKNHPEIHVTHVHLNDNTIAGIELVNKPVFSVQYHPEASAGPHDSRYLFDQFIDNMNRFKN